MSALTLFTSWVRANCTLAPARRDLLKAARLADAQRADCHFWIGAKVTRKRQAYLAHLYAGELFVFGLSEEQAREMRVLDVNGYSTRDHWPRPTAGGAVLRLEDVDLEDAANLDLLAPIRGTCRCHFDGPMQRGLCVRLDAMLTLEAVHGEARWLSAYCYPFLLVSGKQVELHFHPLRKPGDEYQGAPRQTRAVFLRVTTPPDSRSPQEGVPLSNVVGVLVTFR